MAKEVAFGAEEAASVVDCSAEANEEEVQGLARFIRKQNMEFADQLETFIAQLRGTGEETAAQRTRFLQKRELCLSCFEPNLNTEESNFARKRFLDFCNEIHHPMLHQTGVQGTQEEERTGSTYACTAAKNVEVALGSLPSFIVDSEGRTTKVTVMLDEGLG